MGTNRSIVTGRHTKQLNDYVIPVNIPAKLT